MKSKKKHKEAKIEEAKNETNVTPQVADHGPKAPSLWARLKGEALQQNLVPVIFSSHCCNCLWDALEREELRQLVDFQAMQEQSATADLLIVHGPVNAKRLAQIQSAHKQLAGKKYVLGVGTCGSGTAFEHQVQNLEQQIPFDLIVPGCPVSADAVIDGIKQLRTIR